MSSPDAEECFAYLRPASMWAWLMGFKTNTGTPTTIANRIGMKELKYCERITKFDRQEMSTLLEKMLPGDWRPGVPKTFSLWTPHLHISRTQGSKTCWKRQLVTPTPSGWACGRILSRQISPGTVLHHRLPSVINNSPWRVFESQGKLK